MNLERMKPERTTAERTTQERTTLGQAMTDEANRSRPENHAQSRGLHDAASSPKDLKVQIKAQRLLIEWNDGVRSEFSLDDLRRQCPCASCRTDREEAASNPLRILKSNPTGVRVTSAELVGNYAIKLRWSDGHDTGIFDFRFLRELSDAK